jgi:hypothetical protein
MGPVTYPTPGDPPHRSIGRSRTARLELEDPLLGRTAAHLTFELRGMEPSSCGLTRPFDRGTILFVHGLLER